MASKKSKPKTRPGLDEYGRSPLHYAASDKNLGQLQELLAAGADPNLQDDNGWSPLHFAAQSVFPEAAAALIASGASVHLQDRFGNTALWRATFNSRGDGSVIKLLRAAGANPNTENESGVSPLQLARTIANYNVAQFFSDV